jgi:DNA-binding protein H-NS
MRQTDFNETWKGLNMARQLAARTVVAWFGNLSFNQQNEVLGQMQQAHDQARSTKRAELESQLAALGFAMPKKRGRPRANASNALARKSTRRTGKVKAKYRDPKTNETWSGRGRMASWLKSRQDAGEKIEKYLV